MKKIFALTFLIPFFAIKVNGQDNDNYQAKIQINPSFGAIMPITKLLEGKAPDYLLSYENEIGYWQVVSGTYFFRQRLGVQFDVQVGFVNKPARREEKFQQHVLSDFGRDQYFVVDNPSFLVDQSDTYARGRIGLVYRFEHNRWFLYPKFSVGISSISAQAAVVYLKEKDTNNMLKVSYQGTTSNSSFLDVAAGFSAGYKLSNRVYLNIDIAVSHFRNDIDYKKTVKNLANDDAASTETIAYRRTIFNLNAGAGVIIVLQKFKAFRSKSD
jgi:hypothetical protein